LEQIRKRLLDPKQQPTTVDDFNNELNIAKTILGDSKELDSLKVEDEGQIEGNTRKLLVILGKPLNVHFNKKSGKPYGKIVPKQ